MSHSGIKNNGVNKGGVIGENSSDVKIKLIQKQTNDVLNLTRDNINKAIDRKEHLDNLGDKANDLEAQARHFHKQTKAVRFKFCKDNLKLTACIALSIIIVIIIIILIIVYQTK